MIKRLIKNKIKNKSKRGIKNIVWILLRHFETPIIILILTLLVCYITDIFYLGIINEEKSNMKQ